MPNVMSDFMSNIMSKIKPSPKKLECKHPGDTCVRALTYNLSWASQKKVTGPEVSEADFVEACINKGIDCYNKALTQIKSLHLLNNFDVIGIQEVEDPDLVTSICESTGLDGWYRGATWHSKAKVYSGCAIMWNTKTLGTMVTGKTINLAPIDKDARTCIIITTSKNINLIVAHFPWLETQDNVSSVADIINAHITSDGPIIILADTNDYNTFITKDTPLIIKNKSLSHGLSKEAANKLIKSCCWHIPGHKYGHFNGTGDYILSEKVELIVIASPKPANSDKELELYSDHMPVAATIILPDNREMTGSGTRKSIRQIKSASLTRTRTSNTTRKSIRQIKSASLTRTRTRNTTRKLRAASF